jgi:hypothetical protein
MEKARFRVTPGDGVRERAAAYHVFIMLHMTEFCGQR